MHDTEHGSGYNLTWGEKEEVAFWRGTSFCEDWEPHKVGNRTVQCSRQLIPALSRLYPDILNATQLLDYTTQPVRLTVAFVLLCSKLFDIYISCHAKEVILLLNGDIRTISESLIL